MESVLENVMLPDKPIMLRWKQTAESPDSTNTSPIPSATSGVRSFTVSLPRTAEFREKQGSALREADLHGIANMMYPLSANLSFNPIRDRWFEVILRDETWFFTIIYVAARQLEAEHGTNQNSEQVSRLMNHVLVRLKDAVEKAQRGQQPPDSIIGAISCLNGLSNTATWQVHSRGLSELVRAKGGILSIDPSLRTKVCRSDIEGAIDTLTAPIFPPVSPTNTQLTLVSRSSTPTMIASLDTNLATTANDIADFTMLFNNMLEYHIPVDPVELDEHLMIFFHRLLSFTPFPYHHLDTAFKIASILFLKSLMRPLSTLAQTSAFLASTLRTSLCQVREAPRSLTLWLGFWGLLASKGESEERGWFVDKILADVMVLKGTMCIWEEMRVEMIKIFWVGEIFDGFSKQVWEEMEREMILSRALNA
ncbi:hypothetical protein FKW77_007173 [Venturia effusa]|uniref:Transcription factor domain-containing protein n=1 Tax=Venturia effusa TaxID=50376 RepID=A0A517LJ33_9PEZI|nr:hypothetical protein FKW77_007173 [Venturia effusa]